MPAPFTIPKGAFPGFAGYISNPQNAGPDYLSQPSENCLVTDDGIAESRKGYFAEFSIGVSGSAATCFYHSTYDICFFALGTKVYYRDFNNNTTVDTGLTLTTGKITRITEFFGDIYLTNTTDGIVRICCFRLNDTAANSGDATFTVDLDGLGRMTAFGDTTGNFRINGTDESVASFVVGTGVCTHSTTLSKSYSDNAIILFIDNAYSSLDEPSKIAFWKSRMHIMGFPSASNADQPNNTVLAGQFVIGQTGAAGIELIIDLTFGTGGSTKITVGGGGKVTNILPVADTFYFFSETKVFSAASSDVTISGSAIGATTPDEKDELHGCFNEDCATVMGNNAITYYDDVNHRIMRIPIDTDTGAALSAPEEDFDVDIRDHLQNLSKNQTGAFVYHYRGGRQTIYQLKEAGQWKWFIYDHNIVRRMGSNFVRGAWQPPQRVVPVRALFERKGVLYGTDISTDTVYSFFTVFADDQASINTTIATGQFDVGASMLKKASLKGDISYPAKIRVKCYVWNKARGKISGSEKVIDGSGYSYNENESVGAVATGESGVSEVIETAKWDKDFYVFPSEATRAQLVMENYNGGYVSLSAFSLTGDQYQRSFSPSI